MRNLNSKGILVRMVGLSAGIIIGAGAYFSFAITRGESEPAIIEENICHWVLPNPVTPAFTPYGHGCGGATPEGYESSVSTYVDASGVKVTVQNTGFPSASAARTWIARARARADSAIVLGIENTPWAVEPDDRVLLVTRPDSSGRSGVLLVRHSDGVQTVTAASPEEALALELFHNTPATAPN